MLVFTLNKYGNPLMPCKPRKARTLLKKGEAEVVKLTPFTIKLKYGSAGYKQPVALGVDSEFQNIGLSALTRKQELLASASTLLAERRGNLAHQTS